MLHLGEIPLSRVGGLLFGVAVWTSFLCAAALAAREPAAEGPDRDAIDARAPRDPRLESIWIASQEAIARNDWKSAIDRLQSLLDLPDDALVLTRDPKERYGRGDSLRQAASRALAAAPSPVLADYERQNGGLARQMLDTAQRTQSVTGLVDVATRFPLTQAGLEAARTLTAWHFDQSEFALAFRGYRSEWDRGGAVRNDVAWRLQAAYAAAQVGDQAAQTEWLTGLLTAPAGPTVTIGGRDVSPHDWWTTHGRVASRDAAPLTDWSQLGGTGSRNGRGSAGEPLLLADWSVPLTTSPVVRQSLELLLRDLADAGAVTVAATSPVVIGNRVAFRDLRGVRVVAWDTGRTLWETVEGISPERILSGLPGGGVPAEEAWQMRLNARQLHEEYVGESAQSHPLASWLFRDGVNGQISSDGRRLFVLEDVAVITRNQAGYQWEGDSDPADPFGANWGTNRLSAYDLASGRLAWTVGGPAAGEVQEIPLAGTFFLGAPVVEGGELYVIATQGEEIRLHALDPQSGRPRWSQLLAYSDTKIELDIVRRWIGATTTVGQGIVICPTTAGWLVAVDRLRRQLLWATRYQPRHQDQESSEPESQFLPQKDLNDTWAVGAPVLQGSRVLFAPPDAGFVYCFNLLDGRILWQRPQSDGVALVGATDDHAVVLARSALNGLSLTNGRETWSVTFPDDVRPSGRPAWLGEQVAVPLSDGQLWQIDSRDGRVVSRQKLPAGEPPLENLVKVRDRLLSVGARGCRSFRERADMLADIAARRAAAPEDPLAVLQQAELLLLDGRWAEAAAELRRHPIATWPANLQDRCWNTLWQSLEAQLAAGADGSDARLAELQTLARTEAQRWSLGMLEVDRRLAARDFAAAFARLQGLLRQPGPETFVVTGDRHRTVHRAAWLRGRFEDVWTQAPAEVRRRIDDWLREGIDRALAGPVDGWLKVGSWCEFHPQAARLHWALADEWAKTRQFATAEAALSRWIDHADPAIAVESRLRLARLWQQFRLPEDAAQLIAQLPAGFAQTRLSTGQTAGDFLAAHGLHGVIDRPVSAEDVVRRRRPLVPQRTMTGYAAAVQTLTAPADWPSFERQIIQVDPQEQRLTIQDRATGGWLWLSPLRTSPRSEDTGVVPAQFLGHRLLVLHRDVLHLLSPVDRGLVWALPLGPETVDQHHAALTQVPSRLLDPQDDPFGEFGLFGPVGESGPLAAAHEDFLILNARRRITAIDPRNGRELWHRDGLPPYALVAASRTHVFVHDPNTSAAFAFRGIDGQPVEAPQLDQRLERTLVLRGSDAITLEAGPGLKLFNLTTSKTLLRRVDVLTGVERWQAAFRAGTVVGLLSPGFAVAVLPVDNRKSGQRPVAVIDLDTGRQQIFAGMTDAADAASFLAFSDAERLYVLADSGGTGSYHYGDSLAALDVTGNLFVWERSTGDLLWRRPIEELNLVFDRFAEAPMLIFLARQWEMLGNANYTRLRLLLLDKQTGAVLHESNGPSLFSGFHGVEITAPDETVELTSYNLRLKFVPAPADASVHAQR